jgi:hypothetical protein
MARDASAAPDGPFFDFNAAPPAAPGIIIENPVLIHQKNILKRPDQ